MMKQYLHVGHIHSGKLAKNVCKNRDKTGNKAERNNRRNTEGKRGRKVRQKEMRFKER